jgi:pimeloyl-ACP methyl ester carboxylesterase
LEVSAALLLEDHWWPYRDGFIHYVDEGRGPAVLLLQGNPTWSYLYRNVIKELRADYRLIGLDYPGFGMSKAPEERQSRGSGLGRSDRNELCGTAQGGPARHCRDELLGLAGIRAAMAVFPGHGRMATWLLAADALELLR